MNLRNFILGTLFLYSVASFCSIAALEILSILLSLVAIVLWGLKEKFSVNWKSLGVFEWSLIGFNLVVFLSLVFSPIEQLELRRAFSLLKITIWCFSLTYLLKNFVTKKDVEKWLPIWGFLIGVVAVYTIIQFFTGIDLIKDPPRPTPYRNFFRATGFFSMALTHSYILGMAAMLLFPFSFVNEYKNRRWLFVSVSFFGFIAIILTLSRGLWMGFVPAFALSAFLLTEKKMRWIVMTTGLLLCIGAGFTDFVQDKVKDLFDPNFTSYTNRIILWKAYGSMFLDHFPLGVGWQQIEVLLPDYIAAMKLEKYDFFSHPHNNFLLVLAGVGAIGGSMFFGVIGAGFKMALDFLNRNRLSPVYCAGVGLLASQIIFHIGGLTECNFTDSEVNHFLMSQYGVMLALRGSNEP